ncbi:MAG: hypothetical protein Q9207_007334 [Kuettlingeria erythrocarpa]
MTAIFSTSLGRLASLPLELRDQVWAYLSIRSRLALLRTSRQLYTEGSPVLYKDVDLQFNIEPRYEYKSWLRVGISFEAPWALQSLGQAITRGFDKLPFERLRQIRIVIEAPNRDDPGQLVCVQKKCLHLAELLDKAQHGLPHLELHFTTSQSGEWGSANKPQSSIAPFGDAILDNDYEILLHAFCRLRNASSANIYMPAGYDKRRYFADDLAESLTWKEPFGTVLSPGDPNIWNDEELQEETDNILMGLDLSLDLLPGNTANMMRLDRFSRWYTEKLGGESRYEREYEHMIGTWKASSEERRITSRLQWRHGAMRAFDPWQDRRSDRRTRYKDPFTDDDDTDDEVTDEWDEDGWQHMYGLRGIPSFDTEAFASMVSPSFRRQPWIYEDDFTEKLRAAKETVKGVIGMRVTPGRYALGAASAVCAGRKSKCVWRETDTRKTKTKTKTKRGMPIVDRDSTARRIPQSVM